ncbi:MAG: ABC transporter substrate-binding protein [Rhodocyclales bacterium]|nr:ABC transporter substrate-binding protein [Rhodocyclales bacterium]
MQKARTLLTLAGLALAATLPVHAQVKIGVIASSTGAIPFVGIPQKNAVALLPAKIGDLTVEYLVFDDASDPTQSVQLTKKLLGESKIDALIGPSGSGNAMGVLGFMAEAQTPMLAPVGTAAVVLPMDDKKRWVFKTHPNDDVISEGLVAAMAKRGVKSVAFIGRNDPYGENWYKTFAPMAEKAGIKIVANERYGPKDTTALAQALKMVAAKPDAMMVAGVGAAPAMPHAQIADAGYKGPIFQTHGAASGSFLQIGGKKVEGALMLGPLVVVPDEIPDSAPSKAVTLEMIKGYEKAFGAKPPIFAAGTYDAGLLLVRAIPIAAKKGKPGTQEFRTALRDALEETKDLKASQGPINMSPKDHSGYDLRGQVMITVKDGKFALAKD